jgi:hypothetical protein
MIIIIESIDNLINPERLTVYVQLLCAIASKCSFSHDPHSHSTQSVIFHFITLSQLLWRN